LARKSIRKTGEYRRILNPITPGNGARQPVLGPAGSQKDQDF